MSELGMNEPTFNFHQDQMNSLDCPLDGFNFQPFSSESYYPQSKQNNNIGPYIEDSHDHAKVQSSAKLLKTINRWNYCNTEHINPKAAPSFPQLISFNNSISSPDISHYAMNPKNEAEAGSHGNINLSSSISMGSGVDLPCLPKCLEQSRRFGSGPRSHLHAKEQLVAERKRREKVSQRLIALSALVPGLKKMDKASILGDATKYLKHLQELVKKLEEEAAKKTTESSIILKKSRICIDDEKFHTEANQYLPEIEARVLDGDVLIRILCEKNEECIVTILREIEKHHLIVVKSNILPFGKSTSDITVVAQMEVEFAMTLKDLVESIRLALLQSMSIRQKRTLVGNIVP